MLDIVECIFEQIFQMTSGMTFISTVVPDTRGVRYAAMDGTLHVRGPICVELTEDGAVFRIDSTDRGIVEVALG